MAITAKYNGNCKVSGKEIYPGDQIENTGNGWALVSETGNGKKIEGLGMVVACGPDPVQDKFGDEYPVWYVIYEDRNGAEIDCETVYNQQDAITRGHAVALVNRVDFENDAGLA